jgi:hypothetical protein
MRKARLRPRKLHSISFPHPKMKPHPYAHEMRDRDLLLAINAYRKTEMRIQPWSARLSGL